MRMFLLTFLFVATACNAMHVSDSENIAPTQWALLVAASKGWGFYRHQGIPFKEKKNVVENPLPVLGLQSLPDDKKRSYKSNPITNNLSSKSIQHENVKEKDEFDIFGEQVAASLRNLQDAYKQGTGKFQIHNILYRLEVQEYQEKQDLLDLEPTFYQSTLQPFDDAVELTPYE